MLPDGTTADIHDVVPMDGFSQIPTIVANLPSNVTGDGLANILDDPTLSAHGALRTYADFTALPVLPGGVDTHLYADGGLFAPGVIGQLSREQAIAFFHQFFSLWSKRG